MRKQKCTRTASATGVCFRCVLLAWGSVKVMLETHRSTLNHGSVFRNHTSTEKEKIIKKRRLGPPRGVLSGAFRRPAGSCSGTKNGFENFVLFRSFFGFAKGEGRSSGKYSEMAGGPLKEVYFDPEVSEKKYYSETVFCVCVKLKTRSRAKARWRMYTYPMYISYLATGSVETLKP